MNQRTALHVSLCFDTESPPSAVAMAIGQLVAAQIPDQLTSLHWQIIALDEEEETQAP